MAKPRRRKRTSASQDDEAEIPRRSGRRNVTAQSTEEVVRRSSRARNTPRNPEEHDPLPNGVTTQGGRRKTEVKGRPGKKRAVSVDKMPVTENRRTVVIKPQIVAKWFPVDTNIRRLVSQATNDAFYLKVGNARERPMIRIHQDNYKQRLIPLMQMPFPKKLLNVQEERGQTDDPKNQLESILEAQMEVKLLCSRKNDFLQIPPLPPASFSPSSSSNEEVNMEDQDDSPFR
uniref:uncharacterized protein isoform X2 n=1 Tax=Myxine glutinosa TaxID=7769 RepID=UPI00358EFFFE